MIFSAAREQLLFQEASRGKSCIPNISPRSTSCWGLGMGNISIKTGTLGLWV